MKRVTHQGFDLVMRRNSDPEAESGMPIHFRIFLCVFDVTGNNGKVCLNGQHGPTRDTMMKSVFVQVGGG